ncbi:MAG: sugar ABC transporter ATP-binding protein [Planctomycetes bacterium]|nr:sugar ABC transporter ATP-binding protein [Planctomycetota bacterium]
MLSVRSLSKRFGAVVALDSIDLDVSPGSIHALMGENGAGKSTLIRCLMGAVRRDGGTVLFEGTACDPASPRHAEAAGLSTVFQEVGLIPHMSVAENITLGRESRRWGLIDRREARARARRALARLGLTIDVDQELGGCSIALQQLVAIARALDVSARLLILDEPTSSLDRRETAELFAVLRRLRDEGVGIIFVTHFLEQVYQLCDRITVLRDGAHVVTRDTRDLPRPQLIAAMLGRTPAAPGASVTSAAPADAAPLLRATGLRRRESIEHADLTIPRGAAVGLAGLLGSGRSELARMLFGIDRPQGGRIELNGETFSPRSPRDAIARGIALTPENRKSDGIVPNLSVRENIVLALQARRGVLRSLSRREQDAIADEFIARLGIKTPHREAPISTLSGGNQQKALLARWLAANPALLILDEPTRGIDIGAKQEIESLIRGLINGGAGVLFISSELSELVRACSRIVVLKDRRTIGELRAPGLSEEHILEAIAAHA